MPAVGQAGHGDAPEWSRRLAAENDGENPVRYLDRPLDELGTAKALIRGIDSLERARLWLAAERRLGRDDGSPRAGVVDLLEERITYLEEHGERPGVLPTEDGPERYQPTTHDRPEKPEWRLNGESWAEARDSASAKLARRRS